eukprot:TRINITY_DN1878_c0_g1_i3.p4 TRINITY_DN1878_c0_g1~~TRINITY_DN1878_c0_g1_i3.p4  ORF type:complete len:170 (-),score=75.70 TRINITY_DN1878_c0_g1_i3:907-1416(-)
MPEKKRGTRSRYVDYGGSTKTYTWDQYEDEVTLQVKVGEEGVRGREVVVEFKNQHLKVGLKGKTPVIDGQLYQKIVPDECTWTLEKGVVDINMPKAASSVEWWSCVIVGDEEIDVKKIEGAKYLDDSILKQIKERDDKEKEEKLKQEQEKKENEENSEKKEEQKEEKKE